MSAAAPRGLPTDAAALGANLTSTTAPTLKKERAAERRVQVDEDAEVYSDPDEGVEIVDMRNVHAMDWMAPESLKWESGREKTKRKVAKVKKEGEGLEPVRGKGAHASTHKGFLGKGALTVNLKKLSRRQLLWMDHRL
jgi:DNA-directed RNA polymerase III subunit RPC4